jgi:hypothetical protein
MGISLASEMRYCISWVLGIGIPIDGACLEAFFCGWHSAFFSGPFGGYEAFERENKTELLSCTSCCVFDAQRKFKKLYIYFLNVRGDSVFWRPFPFFTEEDHRSLAQNRIRTPILCRTCRIGGVETLSTDTACPIRLAKFP